MTAIAYYGFMTLGLVLNLVCALRALRRGEPLWAYLNGGAAALLAVLVVLSYQRGSP